MTLDDPLLLAIARARHRHLHPADPAACQERVLSLLVRRSVNTAFGRAHDFASVRSLRDFLARVPPMTCDDLAEAVASILDGRADVLFPGRPVCFAATSGTMGRPRLVPLNRAALWSSRMSVTDAALLAGLLLGTLAWHRGKTLYVGPRRARPHGRWRIYSEGTAYIYLQPRPLTARFLPRYEDLPEPDAPPDFDALLALVARHRVTSVAGNPLEIAAFVRDTGIVLPEAKVLLNCGWFAADHLALLSRAFPNALLLDLYGANEGTYGLPLSPGRFLLNVRRLVYAFVPLDGGPAMPLADVRPDVKCRLAVTTPGGLWNHLTDDLVSVVSLQPPVIRLCGRAGRTLSLVGELLTEDEVIGAVRAAGVRAERYHLAPGESGYVLHLDGDDADAPRVDAELARLSAAYAEARRAGRLAPLLVHRQPIISDPRRKPVRIVTDRRRSEPLVASPAHAHHEGG